MFKSEHSETENWCQRQSCSGPRVLQNKSLELPLHQLSLLRYMSSKLCLQLHLHDELCLAKIFMMALSQLGVGLHFCLKDLGSLTLRYAHKFYKKLKLKFLNLKTVSDEVQPKGFLVDLDEL